MMESNLIMEFYFGIQMYKESRSELSSGASYELLTCRVEFALPQVR